jgi:hypothetical protein
MRWQSEMIDACRMGILPVHARDLPYMGTGILLVQAETYPTRGWAFCLRRRDACPIQGRAILPVQAGRLPYIFCFLFTQDCYVSCGITNRGAVGF